MNPRRGAKSITTSNAHARAHASEIPDLASPILPCERHSSDTPPSRSRIAPPASAATTRRPPPPASSPATCAPAPPPHKLLPRSSAPVAPHAVAPTLPPQAGVTLSSSDPTRSRAPVRGFRDVLLSSNPAYGRSDKPWSRFRLRAPRAAAAAVRPSLLYLLRIESCTLASPRNSSARRNYKQPRPFSPQCGQAVRPSA